MGNIRNLQMENGGWKVEKVGGTSIYKQSDFEVFSIPLNVRRGLAAFIRD